MMKVGLVLRMFVSVLVGVLRSRQQLLADNAMLRLQVINLRRSVKRTRLNWTERALLLLASHFSSNWRGALHVVQPETLLRWHRDIFRLRWRRRSRPGTPKEPRIGADLVALIRQMASSNRTWGSERIRGELLKLGFRVSKRTIQKYVRPFRRDGGGETWNTFLENHHHEIWSCDFLQLYDFAFRPVFAFFILRLATREVLHVNVTRCPSDAWTAQQLREAMPFDEAPRFLIRDNDGKYGEACDAVVAGAGATVVQTPVGAPNCNTVCERFLGSVRRECLNHILIVSDGHLRRILREYCRYFNVHRPHQGLKQVTPQPRTAALPRSRPQKPREVIESPILGGIHHEYRVAA